MIGGGRERACAAAARVAVEWMDAAGVDGFEARTYVMALVISGGGVG